MFSCRFGVLLSLFETHYANNGPVEVGANCRFRNTTAPSLSRNKGQPELDERHGEGSFASHLRGTLTTKYDLFNISNSTQLSQIISSAASLSLHHSTMAAVHIHHHPTRPHHHHHPPPSLVAPPPNHLCPLRRMHANTQWLCCRPRIWLPTICQLPRWSCRGRWNAELQFWIDI